jgi:glycosyltransferase involved in cell wall biosynthesis
MKVLAIAHNGVLSENQNRWRQLANRHPLELSVLIPPRWPEAQGVVPAQVVSTDSYRIIVQKPVLDRRYYTHFYPGLGQLLGTIRPDVIDVFEEPWSFVTLQTWALNRGRAALLVETEQNLDKRLPPPFEQLWRFGLRRADCVVARSVRAADLARAKGSRRVQVVPHGVDTDLFAPAARPEPPKPGSTMRVLFVGRPELPAKGLSVLVLALRLLDGRYELHVAGPATAHLVAKLRTTETPAVVWHGPVDHEDLPPLYRRSHVVVVPSRSTPSWVEQFGRVLIEAMACGIPIVASRSGAIPEVCADAALLVPEGSPQSLAEALAELHEDEALWFRLRNAGLERVRRHYTWDRVADALWDAYEASLELR